MQAIMVECDECSTESEEYVCATCGQTGAEIANARWEFDLWSACDPDN